jgi:hypothetical protein
MRQRRGMNFMGNSYMDWRKKGKGFFRLSGHADWGYGFRFIRAVAPARVRGRRSSAD